jgi:hypothetical protein
MLLGVSVGSGSAVRSLGGLAFVSEARAANADTMFGWGNNNNGELGDITGTPDYESTPTLSPGLSGQSIVAVAGGGVHGVALRTDGTVLEWGFHVGHEPPLLDRTPYVVPGLHGVVSIAAGEDHDLALESDGSVWAWGFGGEGELGVGSSQLETEIPLAVHGLGSGSGVIAIAAHAFTSYALKSDGSVVGWGRGDVKQLGPNVSQYAFEPVSIPGLQSGVTQIAAGAGSLIALMADGTLRAIGDNGAGELGDGTTTPSNVPVVVSGITNVVKIAATAATGIALKGDGTVWTWGFNGRGDVGDGTTINRDSPVRIAGLPSDVAQIATGDYQTFVITSDGTLYQWGYAPSGNPQTPFVESPLVVPLIDHVGVVGGGTYFSVAIGIGAPTAQIHTPAQGIYTYGQSANADYSCIDPGGPGIASCVGDVPNGAPLDLTKGTHLFHVTATDTDGRTRTMTVSYDVDGPPDVFINVPAGGAIYAPGQTLLADWNCTPYIRSGNLTCTATTDNNLPIDMSLGAHTFTANAVDSLGRTGTASVTYTVQDSADAQVDAGDTLGTTAPPSPADPIQTSVTTAAAGEVSITETGATTTAPSSYILAGQQVDITAPPSTPDAPLTLHFALDASALATIGATPASVSVLRDGVPIADCLNASVGVADPDPCVYSRATTTGGGALLGVYSSHASHWNFATQITGFTITTFTLPNATLGHPYTVTLSSLNGTGAIKWKKTGKLPLGLKLNPKTGVISGTPKKTTGTLSFTIVAKDSARRPKHQATQPLTITVH